MGCWFEAALSSLPSGPPQSGHLLLCKPRRQWRESASKRGVTTLCNTNKEVPSHHLCCICLLEVSSQVLCILKGRGLHKGGDDGRQRSLGIIFPSSRHKRGGRKSPPPTEPLAESAQAKKCGDKTRLHQKMCVPEVRGRGWNDTTLNTWMLERVSACRKRCDQRQVCGE